MKKRIKKVLEKVEDKTKSVCGEITPDKRLVITVSSFVILLLVNLYLIFSSVYKLGKNSIGHEQPKVERTKIPGPENSKGNYDFNNKTIDGNGD